MSEFLAMGGHGFYIWGAYSVAALVIVVETLAVRARRRAAITDAEASAPDPRPPVAVSAGRTPS